MITLAVPVSVRDLTVADLPQCAWSGSPTHLRYVAAALERARQGNVDYLAVCGPAGTPLGIGGVDYKINPAAGTLWQLAVMPALRSCGIGTVLIGALEDRIRARAITLAELSVELDNPRARALYERLGYTVAGERLEFWDTENADGAVMRHETVCAVLRKLLPSAK